MYLESAGGEVSNTIGTKLFNGLTPAIENETIEVSTDDIEQFMLRHFAKGGWDVEYEWWPGQWPKMIVHRRREVQ
jgi:hypothetical protein